MNGYLWHPRRPDNRIQYVSDISVRREAVQRYVPEVAVIFASFGTDHHLIAAQMTSQSGQGSEKATINYCT